MKKYPWILKTISVLLLLIASISLFFAQSSYWVNHTIFNKQNFTSLVSEAVLQPESRDAIASQVVDSALQNRPVAKKIIGDRAEKLISSLLGSDFATQAVNRVVGATYTYLTTSDRQDIKLELAGITTPISTILNLVQQGDSNVAQVVDSIPDEIVLVQSDAFPNLSNSVSLMLWLGPLFWLLSIAGFTVYIYLHREKYAKSVYIVGIWIAVVAIIGILARPALPPPVASLISASNLRPVIEDVADAFLAPFQMQMIIMLGITAVALLIFSLRFTISKWIQKLSAMVAHESVSTRRPTTKAASKMPAKKK